MPDPESELIDFMSQTECEQNYLHVQSPTNPLALRNTVAGGICEVFLIAVTDRGSWLRVTGSDCFVLHMCSVLQEEGKISYVIF